MGRSRSEFIASTIPASRTMMSSARRSSSSSGKTRTAHGRSRASSATITLPCQNDLPPKRRSAPSGALLPSLLLHHRGDTKPPCTIPYDFDPTYDLSSRTIRPHRHLPLRSAPPRPHISRHVRPRCRLWLRSQPCLPSARGTPGLRLG